MSISPANPERDHIADVAEKDELTEKREITDSQIENAAGSQAISEDDDDENFKFTIGKFLACLVWTPSKGAFILLTLTVFHGRDIFRCFYFITRLFYHLNSQQRPWYVHGRKDSISGF
jgi:hypothetical protein